MKLKLEIELEDILKKPMDEITPEDEDELDEAKTKLPENVVKLPKDESMMEPKGESKPFLHEVKSGETLRDICKKYGVSYAEMSNHMMNKQGNTNLHEGMELEIPRHFIDLSEAE